MTRTWSDFNYGTFSGGPYSAVATTLASATFAALPVIASPNTLTIVADPRGVTGAPEKITITTHGSGSTSVTVVRASDGGVTGSTVGFTARILNAGSNIDTWEAPTTSQDFVSLTAQIAAISSGTSTYGTSIATLNSEMTTANTNISTLTGDIGTINTEIANITSPNLGRVYATNPGTIPTSVGVIGTSHLDFTLGTVSQSGSGGTGGLQCGIVGKFLVTVNLALTAGIGSFGGIHIMRNGSVVRQGPTYVAYQYLPGSGGGTLQPNFTSPVLSFSEVITTFSTTDTFNIGAISTGANSNPQGAGQNCYLSITQVA